MTANVPYRFESIRLFCLRHVASEVRREVHRYARVVSQQLEQLGLRKHVEEGVLLRLCARPIGTSCQQRAHAENITVVADVDEYWLAVDLLTDIDLTLDQNVELGFWGTPLIEHDLARFQVANPNAPSDAVQLLGIHVIEGGVPRQAIGHGEYHRIGRHRA